MKRKHLIIPLSCLFALFNVYCSPSLTQTEQLAEQTTQPDAGHKEWAPDNTSSDEAPIDRVVETTILPEHTTEQKTSPDEPKKPLFERPSSGWCSRMAAGPAGKHSIAVDLSMAHSTLRFFGIHKGYPHVDGMLAKGLQQSSLASARALSGYTSDSSICVLSASTPRVESIQVTMKGDVATIIPGHGDWSLPANTQVAILDLRNVPTSPELQALLEKIVAQIITQDLPMPNRAVILHKGMKDEVFSAQNTYTNHITRTLGSTLLAKGKKELPLIILIGKLISPAVARIAGSLRFHRRAWIVGESIPTTIAESRWQGVGQAGIAFRTMELSNNNTLWPDTIQADHPMSHIETLTQKLSEKTELPAQLTGIPQRPRIKPHHYFQKFHTQLLSKASLQAALLIAHGALRAFFPYFSTVGDRIDERLEETLKTATSTTLDDVTARNILRRFGESIKDGHCFVNYRGRSSAKGFMLVELDKLNGKPVIRRTAHTELKVGDTILSINHVSAEKWFTEEYKRTSAATPGYQFDMAARELNRMFGPVVLKLQSVDGDTRTVTVQPQPYEAYSKFAQKPFRPAGFLKDLHAEDVMYVDLDNKAIDQTDFNAVIQMMQNAKSLVLDMRGYPNRTSWQLLQHIATKPLPSPLFSTPEWKGPSNLRRSESSYDLQALTPVFKGPVTFLLGPRSVSSAEHVSTMLKQINRVTFVGRPTAGTNGNITGLVLPGLFTFTFTGMEILYRDRKPFHGIGIVPDIEVSPTPQDLAQGKDPVLQKAIEFLKKP